MWVLVAGASVNLMFQVPVKFVVIATVGAGFVIGDFVVGMARPAVLLNVDANNVANEKTAILLIENPCIILCSS
jgi:hypothetical protein